MASIPPISRTSTVAFKPATWDRVRRVVEQVEPYLPLIEELTRRERVRVRPRSAFIEMILRENPTEIAGSVNRWEYEWDEAQLLADGSVEIKTDGRNSDDFGLAYNRVENGNDGIGWESHIYDLTQPNATITIRPVGYGSITERERWVQGIFVTDDEGTKVVQFSEINPITLSCNQP